MTRGSLFLPVALIVAIALGACRDGAGARDDVAQAPPRAGRAAAAIAPLRERVARHVDSLAAAGGHRTRALYTAGNRWAVDYVARAMRSAGIAARIDSIGRRGLVNVVGIIEGRSDSVLVIGAHVDASASRDRGWSRDWRTMPAPGAVDNATGVAALLEIGAELRRGLPPRYTIELVAFNAEEYSPNHRGHHLGSRSYVRRLKKEGRPVKGAIVLDMVASNPELRRVELFSSAIARPLAQELAEAASVVAGPLELVDRRSACSKSDNESFDRAGVPAVLFMESCAPWKTTPGHPRFAAYHTARDIPSEVSIDVVAEIVRIVTTYARPGRVA